MREKKSVFEKVLNIVVYLIQIITSCILIWVLYSIGSIPMNYIYIAAAILLGLLIGEYFLIFYKKPKSKRSLITKIVSILLSIVLVAGSYYAYEFGRVVNLMGEADFQSRAISVIVLKNSDILNEGLLKDKKLGLINFMDKDSMDYAVDDINKNVGTVSTNDYTDFHQLMDAFYKKEVDAIILDEAFRSLATTGHDDFDEETRVVYQVKKQESKVNAKNVDVTEKPFLVYISGNDEYGELSAISRSDVNMLVAVNPKTSQVLLVSIPRDTYYPLNRNGQLDKFTHAGMYGLEESQATLEDMLDEEINYYVKMNFTSFMKIIDAIGGITVDVPKYATLHSDDGSFTTRVKNPQTKEGYTIKPGVNHFDAREALAFVRERKSFVAGDFVRGKNQQLMISAVLKKVCSPAILTSFSGILEAVSSSIETNMSSDEINSLIQLQLSKMPSWDIQSCQIEGDVGNKPCYSLGNRNASVVIPYTASMNKAIENINKIKNGEKIETETGDFNQTGSDE